jgi:lysophospholipase L1-like esterase
MKLKSIFLFFMALFLSLAVAEGLLRLLGVAATQSEQQGQPYYSLYDQTIGNHYRLLRCNTDYRNTTPDFDYLHRINRYGFVGEAPAMVAPRSRSMVFGDSFTEGVGAQSPDSSFPALLHDRLHVRWPDSVEVVNFGNGGSDVVFAVRYLLDSALRFAPARVVMSLNATDWNDIIQWGGEERFLPDGTARSAPGPWYTSLYEHSRIFRLLGLKFFALHPVSLLPPRQQADAIDQSGAIVLQTLLKADSFCRKNNIELVVVVHPSGANLSNEQSRQHPNPELKKLAKALRQNKVRCIDLWAPMREVIHPENGTEYYWPMDGHFTHQGYGLMAQILADSLTAP